MPNENYEQIFEKFKEFFAKERERKEQGYSDFNPFKILRNPYDEVHLHSGILHYLLSVDLLLYSFLRHLGLVEWFGDTAKAQVLKEYKNIDIYITNGTRHIIIENKIRASDAQSQLARYIETIHNLKSIENLADAKKLDYENIAVLYLHPFGKKPSKDSRTLNNKIWEIVGDMLKCDSQSVEYRQLSYEKDILAWIENCQKEVSHITAINSTLEFYKDIVKIITNQKENEMKSFLTQRREFIAVAAEIKKIEIEELCTELFLQEIANEPEFADYERIDKGVAFGFCKRKYLWQKFKFMLTLEKTVANRYLGFRLHINGNFEKDLPNKLRKVIEKNGFKLNSWGWWLVDEKGKDMLDLSSGESLKEYFLRLYKKVDKLNDFLGEQEKQNGSEIAKLADEVKSS